MCVRTSVACHFMTIQQTHVPQGLRRLSHSFSLLTPSSPPVHSNTTTYNMPWLYIPFPGQHSPIPFSVNIHHFLWCMLWYCACPFFSEECTRKMRVRARFSPVVFHTLLLSSYNLYYLFCMAKLRAFNSSYAPNMLVRTLLRPWYFTSVFVCFSSHWELVFHLC
jgi:hypothetical protein